MLIALDFDGVLANSDPFVRLAEQAGEGDEVAALMDRLWHKELDYEDGLRLVADHLDGIPVDEAEQSFEHLQIRPEAPDLLDAIHEEGHETAIVTDAPKRAVRSCLRPPEFDVDTVVANRLPTQNNAFTGEIEGPLVGQRKDETLKQLAVDLEEPMANTVAIGDDWRDLPMMQAAGLGIGLNPDPAVRAQCDRVAPSITRLEEQFREQNIL